MIGIRSGAGAPSGYSGQNCRGDCFFSDGSCQFQSWRKTRGGRRAHCPLSIPDRRCNPMSVVNWRKDKTQNDEQRLFLKARSRQESHPRAGQKPHMLSCNGLKPIFGPGAKALALGLIAGMAYPFIDLALACRAPTSEACVWGKAYLPLTLGLSLVIVGGVVAILTYLFLARKRHRKSNHDTE